MGMGLSYRYGRRRRESELYRRDPNGPNSDVNQQASTNTFTPVISLKSLLGLRIFQTNKFELIKKKNLLTKVLTDFDGLDISSVSYIS